MELPQSIKTCLRVSEGMRRKDNKGARRKLLGVTNMINVIFKFFSPARYVQLSLYEGKRTCLGPALKYSRGKSESGKKR